MKKLPSKEVILFVYYINIHILVCNYSVVLMILKRENRAEYSINFDFLFKNGPMSRTCYVLENWRFELSFPRS